MTTGSNMEGLKNFRIDEICWMDPGDPLQSSHGLRSQVHHDVAIRISPFSKTDGKS